MLYFILFIFGSAIGSFLNVLIYRLEQTSICRGRTSDKCPRFDLGGRSYCPHCKHQIRWYDNIPILSFFILRAKCRDCGQSVSMQYPLVEAATGLLFIIVYYLSIGSLGIIPDTSSVVPATSSVIPAEAGIQTLINLDSRSPIAVEDKFHGNDIWVVLVYLLIAFSGLFAILVYDFKHYIIPNKIIYPLIAFVLSFGILNLFGPSLFENWKLEIENFNSWQGIVLSLLIPAFFLSLIIISRGRWMGMGDVKLALFMSLFLGWPNVLIAAVLSFWLGTLASLPLLVFGGKNMKSQIPFGPFLIIGTFIAYFWGNRIVDWYLKISL